MSRQMPSLPSQASEESGAEQAEQPQAAPKVSRGIDVVALRSGFYEQRRIIEGEKFTVKKAEQLGSWMRCIDPVMQKKHQENLKAKKDAVRQAGGKLDAGE